MIITISGVSGSGKSSVAKLLAKMLNYKHYSMGDLQREIAKEKGISIADLGELEKKDSAIDREIDEKQAQLAKREDDFVIDSWLGAHFIPNSFKVFLDCDFNTKVQRIYNAKRKGIEEYNNLGEAKTLIKQREKTNRERWVRYYDFDFLNKGNYDIVIDTTNISIEETANRIIKCLEIQ
ncbi:cytidylate kinase family protein [Candidatus Woesearchaeota archaeon]|nr:cytidylate kinase family protein [Candidatus Woesearchaeota archaeon]